MKYVSGLSLLTSVLMFSLAVAMPSKGKTAPGNSEAPSTADGEALFKQRCAACHTVAASGNGIGPNLRGVVGRPSGTAPGFAYSPAMTRVKQPWTAARLDTFLAGPQKLVPGTRMFMAVPAAADRQAIISYLAKAH